MVRKLRNKKGSIEDLVFIFVSLFTIAVVILIIFKVSNSLNTEFQASNKINTRGKAAYNSINNLYPGVVDNSMLFLVIGLCITALMFAMMVRVHPVFFILYIIILAILIFVSAAFSNVYQQMAAQTDLASEAAQLTFTTNILTYLPFLIGVFGFLLAIVMYKSWQNAQ